MPMPPRRSLAVAFATLACLVFVSRLALADVAVDPWQLYMDSSARALQDGDIDTAILMLETARSTSLRQGGVTIRNRLANFVLYYVYRQAGRDKQADELKYDGWSHFDMNNLDDAILDVADAFRRFSDSFFDRWKKNEPEPPGSRRQAFLISGASTTNEIEVYFRQKLFDRNVKDGKDASVAQEALAIAYTYACLLSDRLGNNENEADARQSFDKAIASGERAFDLWQTSFARLENLRSLDEQFPSFKEGQAFGNSGSKLQTMLETKIFLSQAYNDRARNEMSAKPKAALDDIESALKLATDTSTTLHQYNGATLEFSAVERDMALYAAFRYHLLEKINPTGPADAAEVIKLYQTALDDYTAFYGVKGAATRDVASDYIAFLREVGHQTEAKALGGRFDID